MTSMFGIPYIAEWNEIGEMRQHQINCMAEKENSSSLGDDYNVIGEVLVLKMVSSAK